MRNCIGLALSAGLLTGCATADEPRERTIYKTVPVAVAAGCVTGRPDDVIPLNQRIAPETWAQRPPGAKARSIEAQAGERMNHTDKLKAATSGCKDAPSTEKPE